MNRLTHRLLLFFGAAWMLLTSSQAAPIELPCQQRDAAGRKIEGTLRLEPKRTAVIVIDMWDRHWCTTFTKRVANMVPRMNQTLGGLRKLGIQVVWAPSDVVHFYDKHPRRVAMVAVPAHSEPAVIALDLAAPPEGLDRCECGPDRPCQNASVWTRQHPGLEIGDEDFIGDCNNAQELFNFCAERDIDTLIYTGVASNMCVCHRSFGLINLKRHGFRVLFVRDLVEAITANGLNPATLQSDWNFTPAKGSARTERYLEQNLAPSLESRHLIAAARPRPSTRERRPHIVFVIGDDEYESDVTLPDFARAQLAADYDCTFCLANGNDPVSDRRQSRRLERG